ncbi:MAG: tRNA methyltransferase [Filomicrobium sp.]|nr:tRNA methyltransferase [Filomicrobium sp.]
MVLLALVQWVAAWPLISSRVGIEVVAYDILPERVAALTEIGAEAANSPKAVAASASRTITMVETTAQTEAVIFGAEGIVQTAKSGHQIAMMSTIDPVATKRMHAELASKEITMVDAPVSGGTLRAASGELSIIVGGDDDTVEGWRPYFEPMASNIFHVGQIGQGLAMKLVNNMLIQVNTVAIAEAFALGAKAGLDPQKMYDVVRVSTGASFALDHRVPRFLSGDFEPGGSVDISYKDQELGVPLLLANVSQQVYQMARAKGLSKEYGAAVIKLYEEMVGVKLGPR